MQNIRSNAEGVATIDVMAEGVTLGKGGLNDVASRAVVVHALPDDYRSHPRGTRAIGSPAG